jgi:hypothetical protein
MKNLIIVLFFIPILTMAQNDNVVRNVTPVGAFFLNIPTDPRAFGMGNLTVASGDGSAASFSNPGRVPIIGSGDNEYVTSAYASYTPIATNLTKNIHALNLTAHRGIGKGGFVGLNIQYFSLGEARFYDEQANESGSTLLQEYAVGLFYAKRFSAALSMGLTTKVIVSSLAANREANGINTTPGFALAIDYGLYGETASNISYGLTLTNMGTKISYSNSTYKSYLPMNIKFGGGYKYVINEKSYLFTGLEVTKPLIPSDPVDDSTDSNGNEIGASKSIPSAIFSSFTDSPSGFSGEINEFGMGAGAEFCFNDLFFTRMGYFSQGKQVVSGGYFTLGLGFIKAFSANRLKVDLAYAVPTKSNLALRGNFKIGLGFSVY